jgi:hypothetical protein
MKKFTIISTCLLFCVLHSYGQWVWEEDNLSMAKAQMGVASLGSKVFFAGGWAWGTGALETIETYDVETGVKTTDDSLSAARILPVGTTCGSRVFFAGGGIFPTTFFKQVDIYYSLMDLWDYDNLSEKRFDLSAVSQGSKVLFAGGINLALSQSYDIVDVYDTVTGWTTTNLSLPRGSMGSAVVGDLALFAGGYDNQSVYDRVDIYNFTTGQWSTDTLSEARGFVSATTVGNKVLIAGGFKDGFVSSSRVDIYDASNDSWSTAELSVPRCSQNVFVTVGKYAFYVGGGSFDGQYLNDPSNVVDVYDSDSNTWSVINLPVPLVWHSVTTAGNRLVVAGGQTFDGTNWLDQDLIYILDVGDGINDNTIMDYGLGITNYPNPVSQSTTFSYTLKEPRHVTIQIFNSFGQMITEPLNAYQSKGEQKVAWNTSDLPSGIYFYRILAGKEVGGGKMIKW